MGGFHDPHNSFDAKNFNQRQDSTYDYDLPKAKRLAFDGAQKRGALLTILLGFIFLATLYAIYHFYLDFQNVGNLRGRYAPPGGFISEVRIILLFLIGLNCLQLVFAVALWFYKGWGYYGLMCGYVVSIIMNLCGGGPLHAVGNVVVMCILGALVSRIQHSLE